MNLGVTLVHCFLYGRRYVWDYQLPPYSEVVHILDGHRNVRSFFYFIIFLLFLFFTVGTLGVLLPILIAPRWRGMHRGHVSHSDWLEGLVSGETFLDFPHFLRQTFLTIAFPFSFLHFVSAFGLSNFAVALFALCLLSFLSYF